MVSSAGWTVTPEQKLARRLAHGGIREVREHGIRAGVRIDAERRGGRFPGNRLGH